VRSPTQLARRWRDVAWLDDSGIALRYAGAAWCSEHPPCHAVAWRAETALPGHLVNRPKEEGHWVRGVDVKDPEFGPSGADEFLRLDLRDAGECQTALSVADGFDEVYQLAAMGFIHNAGCEIMRNSALVNINMLHATSQAGAGRYFLSSWVCIWKRNGTRPDSHVQVATLCEKALQEADGVLSIIRAIDRVIVTA